jgi:hypothetical protein
VACITAMSVEPREICKDTLLLIPHQIVLNSFLSKDSIGEDYYPLPWSLLTYNPRLEGYEVNVSEQQLKGAPKYSRHETWDWSDRAREKKVYEHYGVGAGK